MLCVLINAMEGPLISSQQFAFIFPVGLVIVFAVLVFAFGFRSSVEPPSFKYISSAADDRKTIKKKKIKDKKPQSNGHAVLIDVVDSKKADVAKPKPNKVETPKLKKSVDVDKTQEKKADVLKSPSKKEKKAKKNVDVEKPSDFDDGEWEIAPSRKDKKSKRKDDDVLITKKSGTKKDGKLTILEAEPIEILRIEDILPKPIVELTPTPIPVEPTPAPEPVVDDQAAKKKKAKKTKPEVAAPAPEQAPVAPEPAPAVAPAVAAEPVAAEPANETLMAFNELEDAWKEAPQKKSKKKVRKD